MKKIILLSSFTSLLLSANISFNTSLVSNTYNGVVNKKDLNGVYNKPTTFDKTTIFNGWSENIVQNGTFDGTGSWNVTEGSGFKAEINNGKNRDNNPFMFGKGSLLNTSGFKLDQNIYNKVMPYMYYVNINYNYTGKEKKDTSQVFLDIYDSTNTLVKTITGNKKKRNGYNWKNYNTIKNTGNYNSSNADISSFKVRLEEVNNNGINFDAFVDDLSIKLLSNLYYADDTNINEKVVYPNVLEQIDVFGQDGHNYIVPNDFEILSKNLGLITSDRGDYVILANGISNYVWAGDGDDTLVGYQGASISDTQRLYGYRGDDYIYLPVYGAGHYAIGGNGWDTVVFRGTVSDYTILHHSGSHDDYDISSANMSARVYECEQICFTNKNVMNEPTGQVPIADMDCYVFKDDGSEDIVKNNLPITVDSKTVTDNVLSVRTQINSITISDNEASGGLIDVYITNLPLTVESFTDQNGIIINSIQYTNGENEDKNKIRLSINGNGDTTFEFKVNDYASSNDSSTVDMSNIKITRAIY